MEEEEAVEEGEVAAEAGMRSRGQQTSWTPKWIRTS